MENYQKIMLEKGREKIDYFKISEYYNNIIYNIYSTIEKEYPTKEEYSNEYLDAYSYLQKAEWNLADLNQLKKYVNEPDFKYFAIENLTNTRNRIEEYLKNITSIFIDYHEYDIILQIKEELQKEPDYNESFKKYKRICYKEAEIKHVQIYIDNIKNYTNILKKELTTGTIKYIPTDNLLETIKLLEKIEKDLKINED